MKHSKELITSSILIGLSSALLVGAFLYTKSETKVVATETSADWNQTASATSADYGTYYNGITGTEGMTLKDQLTDLIKGHTVVSYEGLYTLYQTSDSRPEDGTVFDMYADFHFPHSKTCGNYSKEGDCFNREHSVPQSWFSSASPMQSDAFHLYPTDGKVNGMRGNYPFGEVSNANYTYKFKNDIQGESKRGTSKRTLYNDIVFEPADCYKGDFARSYFYFATRYKDKMGSMSGNGNVHFTSSKTYCNLTQYSKELFLDWHRADPVSRKEINRNNAIYKAQKNRNPFIDHPEYVEAIWGDTPIGSGSVSLSQSQLSMTYGSEGEQLVASSSDNSPITWTTSNATVAYLNTYNTNSGVAVTVIPGVVGSATITATATIEGKNYSSSCTVTVTKQVSSLSYEGELKKTEYTAGESFDPTGLTVTAVYTDSSSEDVTNDVVWSPNPLVEGITSVEGSFGNQKITVNGITVAHSDTPVSSKYEINMTNDLQMTSSSSDKIAFSKDSVSVTINKSGSTTPANNYCPPKYSYTRAYADSVMTISAGGAAFESIVIHCSSYANGAGIEEGAWTNGSGTRNNEDINVSITDKSKDVSVRISKKSEMVGVTVVIGESGGDEPSVSSVTVTPSSHTLTLPNNVNVQLTATVSVEGDASKTVSWSSSNEAVAEVSSSGYVTGKSAGTAVITATSTVDTSKKGTCTINVISESEEIIINEDFVAEDVGETIELVVSSGADGDITWSWDEYVEKFLSIPKKVTANGEALPVTITGNGYAELTATDTNGHSVICTIVAGTGVMDPDEEPDAPIKPKQQSNASMPTWSWFAIGGGSALLIAGVVLLIIFIKKRPV